MAEAGENPPLHHLHADLDFGFIPGTGGAGRDDGHAIVLREFGVGPVEGGLVAMGPAHGGLEIIRDHDLGHPTERRKGADMGPDPVGETLAPSRFGEGIVGGAQDGDEDRGFADFPREGIDDRHRLARIVDKECLARAVALPHDQIEFPSPLAIGFTELAVLEAIGGDRLVFLPQQEQGDPLTFELLVDDGPVRDGTLRYGCVGGRRKQPSLQGRIIEGIRQGPGQTCRLRPPHVLGHGGSTDP